LLAPAFVDGLGEAGLDDVRHRRDECKRVEDMVSYLRRVIQGQIDLVTAEVALRRGGARGDVGQLVDDLPNILAGPAGPLPTGGQARPIGAVHNMSALQEAFEDSSDLTPDEIAAALSPELAETLFPGGSLPGANLGSFTDPELVELAVNLREQEQALSAQRRVLHERIDQLQAAIVERYKSGVADVDSLLADMESQASPERDEAIHGSDEL
jgi:hypothetical protein